MGQSDRWGDLASELGIEASAASVPPPAPAAPKPAPPAPATPPRAAAPRPEKPSTDWSRLADDLGIDPNVTAAATPRPAVAKPPVPPQRPPARDVRPEPRREQTPYSEPAREQVRPPAPERFERRPEDHRRRSERTATEPGRDFSERAYDTAEPTAEQGTQADAADYPSRQEGGGHPREEGSQSRRRGRRGRGGRGRGQRSGDPAREARGERSYEPVDIDNPPEYPDTSDLPWSVDSSQRDDETHFSEFDEPEMLDEDGLPATEAAIEGTEPRKRRRRRRGGRGRKRGDQQRTTERSSAPEDRAPGDADALEFDEFDLSEPTEHRPDGAGATDDDDDLEHESELHGGHRAVPSWEEAVGFLVSANLEARAKCPDSHGGHKHRSRGRGGRGKRGTH